MCLFEAVIVAKQSKVDAVRLLRHVVDDDHENKKREKILDLKLAPLVFTVCKYCRTVRLKEAPPASKICARLRLRSRSSAGRISSHHVIILEFKLNR